MTILLVILRSPTIVLNGVALNVLLVVPGGVGLGSLEVTLTFLPRTVGVADKILVANHDLVRNRGLTKIVIRNWNDLAPSDRLVDEESTNLERATAT